MTTTQDHDRTPSVSSAVTETLDTETDKTGNELSAKTTTRKTRPHRVRVVGLGLLKLS